MIYDRDLGYTRPAMVQSECSRGEPRAYYPILHITGEGETANFHRVSGERDVKSKAAVERQVARFNGTVGLFAGLMLMGWQPRTA